MSEAHPVPSPAPPAPAAAVSTDFSGSSRALRDLLDLIRRAAPTSSNVLITGECGTGKERVARRLHEKSQRAGRPFHAVDCRSLPAPELEREIFGERRPGDESGRWRQACGGTLFLNEVGELTPALQARLLRRLDRRTGNLSPDADVRLVAASSEPLADRVRRGGFREDLYFRMNVIPVHIHALRQRPEDIAPLVHAFLDEFGSLRADAPGQVAAEVVEVLARHRWPGNVRELRSVVERMVSLARGPRIELSDVPDDVLAPAADTQEIINVSDDEPVRFREAKNRTVARFERDYLHRLLLANAGNVTRAARQSGMNRSAFQRLMRKHKLRSSTYKVVAAGR